MKIENISPNDVTLYEKNAKYHPKAQVDQIAESIKQFEDYPIRFFYSICGLQDGTAYASASAAAKNLPKYSDRFTEANWLWQECAGVHDFKIWYLGLFNFLRILGN